MIGVTSLWKLSIDKHAVLAVHINRTILAPSHRRQCVIIATARVVILLINLSQVGQASWTHSFWWLLSGDYINGLRSSTWTRVVRRLHISRVLEDLLNSSFHSFLTWIDKTALTTFFRALWWLPWNQDASWGALWRAQGRDVWYSDFNVASPFLLKAKLMIGGLLTSLCRNVSACKSVPFLSVVLNLSLIASEPKFLEHSWTDN